MHLHHTGLQCSKSAPDDLQQITMFWFQQGYECHAIQEVMADY